MAAPFCGFPWLQFITPRRTLSLRQFQSFVSAGTLFFFRQFWLWFIRRRSCFIVWMQSMVVHVYLAATTSIRKLSLLMVHIKEYLLLLLPQYTILATIIIIIYFYVFFTKNPFEGCSLFQQSLNLCYLSTRNVMTSTKIPYILYRPGKFYTIVNKIESIGKSKIVELSLEQEMRVDLTMETNVVIAAEFKNSSCFGRSSAVRIFLHLLLHLQDRK